MVCVKYIYDILRWSRHIDFNIRVARYRSSYGNKKIIHHTAECLVCSRLLQSKDKSRCLTVKLKYHSLNLFHLKITCKILAEGPRIILNKAATTYKLGLCDQTTVYDLFMIWTKNINSHSYID